MAVEDRAAEGRALDRVAVAPGRAVPAREDELELAGAGLAEHRDRISAEPAAVFLHMVDDFVVEFRIVQAAEDLLDHCLLVRHEGLSDPRLGDLPVGVDLRPELVVEGKTDLRALLRREALVERRDQRLGVPSELRGRSHRQRACGCRRGSFQELSPVERTTIRARGHASPPLVR